MTGSLRWAAWVGVAALALGFGCAAPEGGADPLTGDARAREALLLIELSGLT